MSVVACDGRVYRFRRREAHQAMRELVDRHIGRGWLVHIETSDDVELYRVMPECPHFVQETSDEQHYIKQMVRDAIAAAVSERWAEYREILFELARLFARAELGKSEWLKTMRNLDQRLVKETGDPMFAERVRLGLQSVKADAPVLRAH